MIGLTFFLMGGSYWGRLYLIGLTFFALAVVMPLRLAWAPAALGLLMSATLVGLSLHLRELGREAASSDSRYR